MDTDTDKNAWPIFVILVGAAMSMMVMVFIIENKLLFLLCTFSLIACFASISLLLALSFSKILKPVSFYKKLIVSLFPFLLFSSRCRYWTLKEISPETSYEEYLRITNRERNS
jgi:hypothetical protein